MNAPAVAAGLLIVGLLLRQPDRWYFNQGGRLRGPDSASTLKNVIRSQRQRLNNTTPTLLLLGHWVEIAGWWLLLRGGGVMSLAVLTTVVAMKFRHLQEVSHFALHGVLARSQRVGDRLAELAFQVPLLFVSVAQRRMSHVRMHHPNATVPGLDPNLETLSDAGIRRGSSHAAFVTGVVFPITPRGLRDTIADMRGAIAADRARLPLRLVMPASLGLVCATLAGSEGLVFGLVLPRLIAYPMLSWMSLLVEHRWFHSGLTGGSKIEIEAQRCLRLYRSQHVMRAIARATWLPYGDAFHFAHSAHPAIRWNYLPLLDRVLTDDVAEFRSVLLTRRSVLASMRRDVNLEPRIQNGGAAATGHARRQSGDPFQQRRVLARSAGGR